MSVVYEVGADGFFLKPTRKQIERGWSDWEKGYDEDVADWTKVLDEDEVPSADKIEKWINRISKTKKLAPVKRKPARKPVKKKKPSTPKAPVVEKTRIDHIVSELFDKEKV